MSNYFRYALPLILAFAASGLAAEKAFDPAARAKVVAPYLDGQTRLIVHIDLSRLQIESSLEAIRRIVPPEAFELETIRDELSKLKKMFQEPGFRELFVVSSLEDLPTSPFFIILPSPQADRPIKIEGDLLRIPSGSNSHFGLRSNHLGKMVFFATPEKFERLKTLKPTPRPELAQAFAAAGDTDLQIVLLTNDDDRRVIEELFPTLPKQLGGGPSTIVTHGLRWAAMGLDFPPEPQLRMTIESNDHNAAKTLNAKIAEVLPLLASGKIFAKKSETRTLAADALRLATMIKPTVNDKRIEYTLGGKSHEADALVKILAAPLAESLEIIWRRQTVDKLKQLGLAMHNFHDSHKSFPAQANYDADGRPLLSWRVHILPQLAQLNLYRQFHLDEPWDSPHNRKLIEKMPAAYAMPNSSARLQGRTCFLRPVGENTVCPVKKAVRIKEISDGTSNTIMLVEADEKHAVIWTKPDDIVVDPKQPANGLGGHFKGGFLTTFCDGGARFIKSTISPQQLRAVFTRNGEEVISPDKW